MEETMTYTYDPGYVEQMKDMLMAVGRTNLMAPSKEEFGRLIDRDLSKNSVSKLKLLSDFSVCAIFHQLDSIVEKETEGLLGLEEILCRYKRTSIYYKERLQGFLRQRASETIAKLYAMLDFVIFTDTPFEDDRDTQWDEQWYEALKNNVDLRLVVLLALGVLPPYSGRGMSTATPLEVMRSFIVDYVTREDCVLSVNTDYYQMLVSTPYNLDDRIAAVAVMYKFCKIACLTFSMDLSRTVANNCVQIKGVDIDDPLSDDEDSESPVLWWNEKVEHEFWYFHFVGNAYYMVKCDASKKTYTKYTMFPGSELGMNIGRVLHPKFITSLVEGDFTDCCSVVSWTAEYDRKGYAQRLLLNAMTPVGITDDWAKEFCRLTLQRLPTTHPHYAFFAKNFQHTDIGWQLTDKYTNAFPGTSYVMSQSVYAVAQDHILVQDITLNPKEEVGFDLIEGKYFRIDREWLDVDVHLGDDIGVLILGTDEPDKTMKKYLAFDYNCTYFPIVDDEILFPKENKD